MKRFWPVLARVGIGLTACILFLGPCAATSAQEKPEKSAQSYGANSSATRTGTEKCLSCHGEMKEAFRLSLHSIRKVSCEDCHGAGSEHADSGDPSKILRLSRLPAAEANSWCLNCHKSSDALSSWSTNPHARKAVRCVECHNVHGPAAATAVRATTNAACGQCHRKEVLRGNLPYHHPVAENKMTCVDCHDSHGGRSANMLKADSVNDLCTTCHAQFAGPFTFQHPPVTESCLTCHDAHGSMNRTMLTVSQPMLCLQCHPAHHNGSGVPLVNPCTNCHNSIHGSDVPSSTGGSVFIDKP